MHVGGAVHGSHRRGSGLRTLANACERNPNQREMPMFQAVSQPTDAPLAQVAGCTCEADAVAVSLHKRLAGFSHAWIAQRMGWKSPSYFCEIIKGAKAMPRKRVDDFCRLTGTNLLRQYIALQKAAKQVQHGESVEARIARLAAPFSQAAA